MFSQSPEKLCYFTAVFTIAGAGFFVVVLIAAASVLTDFRARQAVFVAVRAPSIVICRAIFLVLILIFVCIIVFITGTRVRQTVVAGFKRIKIKGVGRKVHPHDGKDGGPGRGGRRGRPGAGGGAPRE